MWLTSLLVSVAVAVASNASPAASASSGIHHGKALTDWMRGLKGGHVHKSLEIQRASFGGDDQTESPYYAIRATRPIKQGEVLMEIPQTHLVQPHDDIRVGDRVYAFFGGNHNEEPILATVLEVHDDYPPPHDDHISFDLVYDDGDVEEEVSWEHVDRHLLCATVGRLMEETALGDASPVAPYMAYLQSQPRGQLPPSWSDFGKELLLEVLGMTPSSVVAMAPLPPEFNLNAEQEFFDQCQPPDELATYVLDETALNYYHLLNQRGWDEVLIPVFDMMSHGNGRLLNTNHNPVREGTVVQVTAKRDIAVGEELYTTYNFCADCENRYMYYGTPELLRDYGFVEGMPQRWFFNPFGEAHPMSVSFEMDHVLDANGNPVPDEYTLQWLEGRPSHHALVYFRNHLVRLQTLFQTILAEKPTTDESILPDSEWNTIVQYAQATMTALTVALEKAGVKDYRCTGTMAVDGEADNSEYFCSSTLTQGPYEDLDRPDLDEWVDDRPDTCNAGENDEHHPYHRNEGETLQAIQSPYQRIEFYSNLERNNDTCFMLDQVTQICTSYRPDYHEMVVHNTARYLEGDVKRVLFVGGGDSMLLHNIIQYPTLEKVVGLEIDQFVTRASFYHFGTRPHFDNEKVEWWFGDATKSLLMLPREYFGSFDLVLVDLSETVASLSVTHHMNVMEALSLLLHPKGIMVKNEYNYFPGQKEVFREALHIHWYAVPYVCSQSLVLGSNGLDLMRGKYTKRDVETIYPLLEEPDIHMGYLHDYQKNLTNPQRYCLPGHQMPDGTKQEKSPGIMMIIEAEDAMGNLETENVQKSVEKAMEKEGFHVIDSLVATVDPHMVVTIMQEGYVATRIYPDIKYCAFDLQLWGSFGKQDAAKKALIEAVGSQVSGRSSSSYRIVSGGMFGIETWKVDEENRGPKIENCDEAVPVDPVPVYDEPAEMSTALVAMQESQIFVHDQADFVSLVLCGVADFACKIADELKQLKNVSDVFVIRPCQEIGEGVEYMQDALSRMTTCEVETWKILDKAVAGYGGKKFRSIVVDPSAPQAFAQIVLKIVSSPLNARRFLAEEMTVAAPLLDLSETWRKMFVDKFRTHLFEIDPSFRAEVYFNSTHGTTFMIALSSSGDKLFGEKLANYVENVEQRTNVIGEIRTIRGNTFNNFIMQDPIITDQNFTDADFDQESQMENWLSQKPMGLQILYQYEIDVKNQKAPKPDFLIALEGALAAFIGTKIEMEDFKGIGEGQVAVAIWSEGSAIVLYDGRAHVDVSLFMDDEDFTGAWTFEKAFGASVPYMTRTLRDTFPRGTGRVVSFLKDLGGFDGSGKPLNTPRWAPK